MRAIVRGDPIIRLDSKTEITKSGASRLIYRKTIIKLGDPDYEKEFKLQDDYFKSKNVINVNKD